MIEGASKGQGLGHQFLRHVERTRLLVHVVDISGIEGREPKKDFEIINDEIENYSKKLSERKQIVLLNKIDLISEEKREKKVEELKTYFENKGFYTFAISAATKEGIDKALNCIINTLPTIEKTPLFFTSEEKIIYSPKEEKEYEISVQKGKYIVEGKMMRRLVNSVNLADYESSMYFQKVLRNKGIFKELEEMGINEGDSVSIEGYEFEYFR